MTMTTGGAISRAPRPSSLADVLDLILDKGLVIDAYVRVSAVGIELLTIDARIVIASVDTYLHYAEAVNRLDLTQTETQGLTGMFGDDSSGGRSSQGNGSRSSEDGQRRSLQSRSRDDRSPGGRGGGDRQLSRARSDDEGDGDEDEESGGGDDEESGGEGRARSIARRIGEKGRWNS